MRPGPKHRFLLLLSTAGAVAALAVMTLCALPAPPGDETALDAWRPLEPGLAFGVFRAPRASAVGDSLIRVLRIDPERFDAHLLNASASKAGRPRTAKQWCRDQGMVAAINASMYQADHRTSVSLMTTRAHVNNRRLSKDMALLAFDRAEGETTPRVTIIDRECDHLETWRPRYGTLVQSIRMLSCRGRNVWSQQAKRWSTAAIGIDDGGNLLFVHARSPFSTHDLIGHLRALPLRLARAMYVEGGPEAQLYLAAGGTELELVGSYETDFNENDDNTDAWPVPNVVAISRRPAD